MIFREGDFSGEVFRIISSNAKHLLLPALNRSFNRFLKGEPATVLTSPEAGSKMWRKLRRMGLTADIGMFRWGCWGYITRLLFFMADILSESIGTYLEGLSST